MWLIHSLAPLLPCSAVLILPLAQSLAHSREYKREMKMKKKKKKQKKKKTKEGKGTSRLKA